MARPPVEGETGRDESGPKPFHGLRSPWGLGAGAFYSTEPYKDFDNEIVPLPFVTYFGPRLFVTGPRAGYKIARLDDLTLSAMAMYNFSGYEEDDSEVFEGMSDREGTIEAGVSLNYELPANLEIEADFYSDVLGRHNGRDGSINLERTFRLGRLFLTPGLGIKWIGAKKADYYYGIRDSEATPERPAYELDDVFNWDIGLRVRYPWSERVMLILMPSMEFLHRDIRESPIVSEGVLLSGIFGIAYGL